MPDRIASIQSMGGVAVATLEATSLTHQEGAVKVQALMRDLAATGALHFVLDIQNLQQIDSACLAALVNALNARVAEGGRIALVNPDPTLNHMFKMTRLDRRFPICHDMLAALARVDKHEDDE